MKKTLLLLVAAMGVASLKAADVSREQAVAMAQERVAGEVGSVSVVSYEGRQAYYIVQFRDGGWVLVSADDASRPVIGYSPDGVYQTADQPDNMKGMMESYARQVAEGRRHGLQRHDEWDAGKRQASRAKAESTTTVAPLITVNWNQSGSYRKYCPESSSAGKAVVGCVAVGMAQAMSVAQWPLHATGDHGYTSATYGSLYINYDNEPAYNWSNILSGANNNDDVARLLWHCGVAVDMDYSASGSGAQTGRIAAALQRNFGYPKSVKCLSRSSYSDEEWTSIIVTELQEGRAVAYAGSDPNSKYGHCFNLDGWDGSFFHVNWGWGGKNNGYFGIDGLNDHTMGYSYTIGHEAIVGVRRPSEKPSDISLSNKTVQAGLPAGTVVADVIVESEATNPVYSYELKGKYSAKQHKYLDAPFEVVDNQLLTTKELTEGTQTVTITATNTANQGSVERTFSIEVTSAAAILETGAAAAIVGEEHYTLDGRLTSGAVGRGVSVVHQRRADGTTQTIKKVTK